MTKPRSDLKQELVSAWRSGATYQTLLDLLTGSPDAYDLLQEIWLDEGYDDSDEESVLKDELEMALERAWYASPVKKKRKTIARE